MELYTLKINVTNQRLSFGENPPEIYSGDQSIDFVEFTFTDDTWNFPNIWAIFYRQKGVAYQIALDDNKVMIPAEVMQKRGYVYIGLMATDGENVQTSSVLQYSIRQGAANVETVTPSPSIYEQFLADLDAYQEAIHNLQTLAATAETLPAGSDATASYDNGVLQLGIPKGDTGETGNGIASIYKTATSSNVDTYTITFTNGQTTTFTVTNGEVTQASFDSLKTDVLNADNGIQTFRWLGNFQHYGLDSDGSFLLSQQYRVSNDDWMTFDRDLTVNVATGFRWGYVYKSGGSTPWSGWFTSEKVIPEGTVFNVQIARTTEIYTEIADVNEFLNAVTFKTALDVISNEAFASANKSINTLGTNNISATWVQGGLYNGADTVDSARIRTSNYMEIGQLLKITCLTGYSATVHQYDVNKNYITALPWTADSFTLPKADNVAYFRIALSRGMGSGQPISVSESSNISFYNDFTDIGLRVQELEEIQKGRSNQYFGEKIPSKVNSFDFSKLFSMSYGSSDSSQDLEIYDDYLFVAFSESDTIKVYSMANYSLLATIPVSIHHGGGIQFSNEFYSNGDPFPLLYVGGWTDNLINILRITNTGGSWSATVTKTLYIPTTEGYYMAPSLDNENNIMYCYGYKNSSYQPGNDNKMKLVKCDLSQLTDNGDSTFTPLILDSIETPYMGVNQGRKYYSGRLYVGFANTSSPHNARFVAIDVNDGHTVTDIDMSRVTTSETEGLCYKIDGNDITWYYSDYFNVFEVLF